MRKTMLLAVLFFVGVVGFVSVSMPISSVNGEVAAPAIGPILLEDPAVHGDCVTLIYEDFTHHTVHWADVRDLDNTKNVLVAAIWRAKDGDDTSFLDHLSWDGGNLGEDTETLSFKFLATDQLEFRSTTHSPPHGIEIVYDRTAWGLVKARLLDEGKIWAAHASMDSTFYMSDESPDIEQALAMLTDGVIGFGPCEAP